MATFAAVWGNRQRVVQGISIGTVLLLAFYLGIIAPMDQLHSVATSNATALGAPAQHYYDRTTSLTRETLIRSSGSAATGVVAGIPGGVIAGKMGGSDHNPAEMRKVIRSGTLELIVMHPAEAVEKVTEIAQ